VGHDGRALGATGPFRGPLRRVATFSTSQRGWASLAVDRLLDFRSVVVDGVFIDPTTFDPRVPVWRQLRARLRERGIKTPVEVPNEAWSAAEWADMRWEHVDAPQKLSVNPRPIGATGPAG
jgi:hypothetical protein